MKNARATALRQVYSDGPPIYMMEMDHGFCLLFMRHLLVVLVDWHSTMVQGSRGVKTYETTDSFCHEHVGCCLNAQVGLSVAPI